MSEYQFTDIEFDAEDLEQLGTKEKFWFWFLPSTDRKWLFKYSRENTGEHWSEKAAEQLCMLIGIPHVEYELAMCGGRLGVITPSAIPESCRMVMGNEVLHADGPSEYPKPDSDGEKYVRVKEHTVFRVLGCLDRSEILPPDTDIDTGDLNASEVFCGYLMLDALISNQDRHHENWAIVVDNETGKRYLCASYDHAASLGRELLDEERNDRLTTRDKNRGIDQFVRKAKSELFRLKTDKKPLSTIDAFYSAVEKREKAKKYWLSRLERLSDDMVVGVFAKIPSNVITDLAREFAVQMVLENKKRLLEDARA